MSDDGTNEGGGTWTDPRWRPSPTKVVAALILLAAIVAPLLVNTYDSEEPRLFGFPFFYWYQFAWVFLAAFACAISYWLLRREARRLDPRRARAEGEQPR